MDLTYQYPPDLFEELVATIPLLNRSKQAVVDFFRGAGVASDLLSDLANRVITDRNNINKFEISRTVLARLNDKGESTLRERREVLKRVIEFKDFSVCWDKDRLNAKGRIAEIRELVHEKDAFTRMSLERERERSQRLERQRAEDSKRRRRTEERESLKKELFALFGMTDVRKRGEKFEEVLNNLFAHFGVLIRESFAIRSEESGKIFEQIDGAIEIDRRLFLVEVKWYKDPIDVNHVSRHLVRVFSRSEAHAIMISASEFTESAIAICKDGLRDKVVSLVLLEEIVRWLDSEGDLTDLLRQKIQLAILDRMPFSRVSPATA